MLELLTQQEPEAAPFWNNSLLTAIIGAILGGLAIYLVEVWKSRRSPRSQLAWDYEVTAPQRIETSGSRAKLNISYGDQVTNKLAIVRFRLNNIGNTLIKDQYLRFALPERAELLETFLDPDTKEEIEAVKINEDVNGCRWKIGYLPPGESVQFSFICDGGDWKSWDRIYPRNDNVVVGFQRRGATRSRDDTRHLNRFLLFGMYLLVLSLLALLILTARSFGIIFYWTNYWAPVALTIVGALSIAAAIEVPGATRAIVAAIGSRDRTGPSTFFLKGELQVDGSAREVSEPDLRLEI